MSISSGKRIFLGILPLIFLTSCDAPIVGSLKNLLEVRSSVTEILGADQVNVSLKNGSHLYISVTNSRYNTMSVDQRRSAADRAAAKTYFVYDESENLSQIAIIFISEEKKYVILTYEKVIDSFKYSKEDFAEMQPN